MLDGLQKLSKDMAIWPYIKWALDPTTPKEGRELAKRTVIGYAICMSSLKKITNTEYFQIMHELRNGEEE